MNPHTASVVITSFNQREYISQAIDSALDQSYHDVEVIVVDDGSTDGSAELVQKSYGGHIRFIPQSNKGPSAAINTGLGVANGGFIAFLGGDDICHRDRISSQIDYLQHNSLDLAFCVPNIIDGSGQEIIDPMLSVFSRDFDDQNLLRILLTEGNFLCAPSSTLRREVVEKIGEFRLGLIQLQDFDYWIRCICAGIRFGRMEEQLISYRRHSGNLSSSSRAFATEVEEAFIVDALLETGEVHSHLRRVFKNLLIPTVDDTQPLSDLEKILLSLGHPNPQLRFLGAQRAIKLYEKPEFRKVLDDAGVVFPVFLQNSLMNQ